MADRALLPPAVEEDHRRAFQDCLLIIVLYMAVRAAIYRAMPLGAAQAPGFSVNLWSMRDLCMSLPRLVALAACLWVGSRRGGLRAWGWHLGLSQQAFGFVAAGAAAFIVPWALVMHGGAFTSGEIMIGWLATGPVAFFEEACFRGLAYGSLRARLGSRWAAVASSALFAAYHLQAQPVLGWPRIFLYGVVYCVAAEAGAGIPWLAAGHWLADGLYFNLEDGRGAAPFFQLGLGLLILAAAVARAWRPRPAGPGAPPGPTP